MRARAAIVVSAVAGALLLAAAPASASITVANQNDSGPGSLREAIATAPPGETIVLPAGTYTLTSEPLVILNKALTISGQGAAGTVVRAGGSFRVFEIINAGGVAISGVTIRDGNVVESSGAGAGILSVETKLTLRGDVITHNTVNSNGATGVAGGSPEGAGVLAVNGSLDLEETRVTENTASAVGGSGKEGGTVDGVGVLAVCPTTIVKSTISGNTADARGGQGPSNASQKGGRVEGVGLFAIGATTITESSISGNTATATGGPGAAGGAASGVGILAIGRLTITNSTVDGNTADARGGQGSSSASQAGGEVNGVGILAVQSKTPPSSFIDSTLSRNFGDASGGPGGEAGEANGGGILEVSAETPVSFSNVTIASNTVRLQGTGGGELEGGGVLGVVSSATISFVGATIANNGGELSATGAGEGGNVLGVGKTSFGDSIVSGGFGPAGTENCLLTEGTSLGFNIDSRDQCGFHAPGDKVNTDPLLGLLQSNGGPTQTMLPAPNSPAVDQGTTFGLATDQRGVTRPIDFPTIANASGGNGADIGAAELQPVSALTLGKAKLNKKKGTATVKVTVPQPAVGMLTLTGKGLKTQTAAVGTTTTFTLRIVTKGGVAKKLRKKGKLKVPVTVTYAPTGNSPATARRPVKLIRKHKKRHHKHHRHGKR
jgi:hypothetical protein